jgi:hypothetical protein
VQKILRLMMSLKFYKVFIEFRSIKPTHKKGGFYGEKEKRDF